MRNLPLPYALEPGAGHRAAIGLIALASDSGIDLEWRRFFQGLDGVEYFLNRVENDPAINAETLRAMGPRLAGAAALIRPGGRLDAMAFGCTSGAMLLGDAGVAAEIARGRGGMSCTNPARAALAGLRALGATRIALISPYDDAINAGMRDHFAANGVTVERMGSFLCGDDNLIARIAGESIRAAVLALGAAPAVEAVFVSCTTMRVLPLIESLEAALGKPVVASNQALAWHALRLAGYGAPVSGFGRLPLEPLP